MLVENDESEEQIMHVELNGTTCLEDETDEKEGKDSSQLNLDLIINK